MYPVLARTSEGFAGSLISELCRINDSNSMMKSGVAYEIPRNCGQRYIGETKRALGIRLKEHQAATRRGETE